MDVVSVPPKIKIVSADCPAHDQLAQCSCPRRFYSKTSHQKVANKVDFCLDC